MKKMRKIAALLLAGCMILQSPFESLAANSVSENEPEEMVAQESVIVTSDESVTVTSYDGIDRTGTTATISDNQAGVRLKIKDKQGEQVALTNAKVYFYYSYVHSSTTDYERMDLMTESNDEQGVYLIDKDKIYRDNENNPYRSGYLYVYLDNTEQDPKGYNYSLYVGGSLEAGDFQFTLGEISDVLLLSGEDGKCGIYLTIDGTASTEYKVVLSNESVYKPAYYNQVIDNPKVIGEDMLLLSDEGNGYYSFDYEAAITDGTFDYTDTFGNLYLYETDETRTDQYIAKISCSKFAGRDIRFNQNGATHVDLCSIRYEQGEIDAPVLPDSPSYVVRGTHFEEPEFQTMGEGEYSYYGTEYNVAGGYVLLGWADDAMSGQEVYTYNDHVLETMTLHPVFVSEGIWDEEEEECIGECPSDLKNVEPVTVNTKEALISETLDNSGNTKASYVILGQDMTITAEDHSTSYFGECSGVSLSKDTLIIPDGVTLTIDGGKLQTVITGNVSKIGTITVQKGGKLRILNKGYLSLGYGGTLKIQEGGILEIGNGMVSVDSLWNYGTIHSLYQENSSESSPYRMIVDETFYNGEEGIIQMESGILEIRNTIYTSNWNDEYRKKLFYTDHDAWRIRNYNKGKIQIEKNACFIYEGSSDDLFPSNCCTPFENLGSIIFTTSPNLSYYKACILDQGYFRNKGTFEMVYPTCSCNCVGDTEDMDDLLQCQDPAMKIRYEYFENKGTVSIDVSKKEGLGLITEGRNSRWNEIVNGEGATFTVKAGPDCVAYYGTDYSRLTNYGTFKTQNDGDISGIVNRAAMVCGSMIDNQGTIDNQGGIAFNYKGYNSMKGLSCVVSGNALTGPQSYLGSFNFQNANEDGILTTSMCVGNVTKHFDDNYSHSFILPFGGKTVAVSATAKGYHDYSGTLTTEADRASWLGKVDEDGYLRCSYQYTMKSDGSSTEDPKEEEKEKPSVTFRQIEKMNLFYSTESEKGIGKIQVNAPGDNLLSVEAAEGSSPHFTVDYQNGVIYVTPSDLIPRKADQSVDIGKVNKKLILYLNFSGYEDAIEESLSLQMVSVAPKLALSQTTITVFPELGINSQEISIKDLTTKQVLSPLDGFESTITSNQSSITAEWTDDSKIKISYSGNAKKTKFELTLKEKGASKDIKLSGSMVCAELPTIVLSGRSFILNCNQGNEGEKGSGNRLICKNATVPIDSVEFEGKNDASAQALSENQIVFHYDAENAVLYAACKDRTLKKATYSFLITPAVMDGDQKHSLKKIPVTVRVIDKVAAVGFSGKGKLDILNPDNVTGTTYRVSLKNISGLLAGATLTGTDAERFVVEIQNDKVVISAKEGATYQTGKKYNVYVLTELDNGALIKSNLLKISAVQTKATLVPSQKTMTIYQKNITSGYGKGLGFSIICKDSAITLNEDSISMQTVSGFEYNSTSQKLMITDTSIKTGTYTLNFTASCTNAAENAAPMKARVKVVIK